MSAIDRNSYIYNQIKPCITIITKTDIKRIFFRGTIGGGLACVGWVCRGGAGPRGAVSAAYWWVCWRASADTGGYYWVESAGLADERACGIYTAVLSLVYLDLTITSYCNKLE